jgi:hypothetical protein
MRRHSVRRPMNWRSRDSSSLRSTLSSTSSYNTPVTRSSQSRLSCKLQKGKEARISKELTQARKKRTASLRLQPITALARSKRSLRTTTNK